MRLVTRQAMCLADTARHVIGCRLTQETRFQNACNDMASDVYPALAVGNRSAAYLALGRKVGPAPGRVTKYPISLAHSPYRYPG
jgi:hypothetical protein